MQNEIETKLQNTLPCLSGAQMGSNHEKNGDRKSHDTLPLRTTFWIGSQKVEKHIEEGIFSKLLFN